MKVLANLSKLCAIVAGCLLVLITLMTCISVIGRDTIGRSIVGDFELSGAAAGAAIALFMPWCQYKRGNIVVDFFTSNASQLTQSRLDRLGALLLALVMALLTWRSSLGGLNAWSTQSGSMMLGFPEWIVYLFMVPPLALTTLIGLHQSLFGFSPDEAPSNPELST
jgi:TRAP-type C4-dicarboxylate transport system permease small subunit